MRLIDGNVKISSDKKKSVDSVVAYMCDVVVRAGIDFGEGKYNPVSLCLGGFHGDAWDNIRGEAIDYWWGIIDRIGIQEFKDSRALVARVAVCILHPDVENFDSLEEQVLWFRNMVGKLGVELTT